jgi:co-chaperonin GroES (HSP10)
MKIQPLGNIIQLEIEEATAGDLITSSRESAVEYAKVVAIGNSVNKEDSITKDYPEVGDHVFVKAWAIDIINYQDKKYYFCNLDTAGVLAIVK